MNLSFREFLALDGESFIKTAYRLLLGREADAEGLDNHVVRLLLGIDRIALLYDMAASREARRGLGPYSDLSVLGDDAFVDNLYLRLLKRRSDPLGKQHYLEVVKRNEGRRRAILEIESSEEFAARNPQLRAFRLHLQEILAAEGKRRAWWRRWRGDPRWERKLNQLLEATLRTESRPSRRDAVS